MCNTYRATTTDPRVDPRASDPRDDDNDYITMAGIKLKQAKKRMHRKGKGEKKKKKKKKRRRRRKRKKRKNRR